jgi:hypothetical protein
MPYAITERYSVCAFTIQRRTATGIVSAQLIQKTINMNVQPIPKSARGFFKGYLVALSIGTGEGCIRHYDRLVDGGQENEMFVCTGYNNKQTWYLVPDLDLFRLLSEELINCAHERITTDGPGIGKFWVSWTDEGGWDVGMP